MTALNRAAGILSSMMEARGGRMRMVCDKSSRVSA